MSCPNRRRNCATTGVSTPQAVVVVVWGGKGEGGGEEGAFKSQRHLDVFVSVSSEKTAKVVSAHRHSHIVIWMVKQCCTVFASWEASKLSTDQIHTIRCGKRLVFHTCF